jgi:hypothetical protein
VYSDSMVEYLVLDTRNFFRIFEYSKFRVNVTSNQALTSSQYMIYFTK